LRSTPAGKIGLADEINHKANMKRYNKIDKQIFKKPNGLNTSRDKIIVFVLTWRRTLSIKLNMQSLNIECSAFL
jgi:hypothetical protein